MVSPADRRYAALQRCSASDTNFRCGKGKWFRLRKPGLHRFLISSPDLRIDARISPFTPSRVHRFLISRPNLGIDASFSLFKPSFVHRFLISGPDLGIDARISPFTPSSVHRFLISGPDLGIDARKPAEDAVFQHLLTSVVCRVRNKRKLLLVIFLKIP